MIAVRVALPALRAARGNVVIISSTSGLRPGGSSAAYATAKAGVNMLAQCLARDLAADGVRVNAICPGWVDTPMAEQLLTATHGGDYRQSVTTVGATTPLGRIGMPADIASATLFLAGPEADWVTGAVLLVDGGATVAEGGDSGGGPPPG